MVAFYGHHFCFAKGRCQMADYTANEKNKLVQKLRDIGIITEKDILNLKVSELKKINESENIADLTVKDIKIIWIMQDAIENKGLLAFFTNATNEKEENNNSNTE